MPDEDNEINGRLFWCSFYLLYWYKSSNIDAKRSCVSGAACRIRTSQVTCITSTKVQIMTPEELRARGGLSHKDTSAKVKDEDEEEGKFAADRLDVFSKGGARRKVKTPPAGFKVQTLVAYGLTHK